MGNWWAVSEALNRRHSLTPLLRPYPQEEMAAYAVSSLVNSPSNEDQRCVEPFDGV
jgi:putative SOS response-associated peptidase YedK